jgi:hypothetical protein
MFTCVSLPHVGSRRRPRSSSGRAATGIISGIAPHRLSAAVLIVVAAVALNAAVCATAAQLNVIVIGAGTARSR